MIISLILPGQLRALPAFEPPPGGWADLQRRMHGARQQRRRVYASLALAASVFAAVGLAILQPAQDSGAIAPDPELAKLMLQSQALERRLSRVKPQVVVWDGRLAAATRDLQTELAVVDLQLNYAEPESARRLWRNRVALMSQLVQTHRDAALTPVSYQTFQENSL